MNIKMPYLTLYIPKLSLVVVKLHFLVFIQDSLVCLVHIGDKFIKESYIIAQFYRNAAGLFHRLTVSIVFMYVKGILYLLHLRS